MLHALGQAFEFIGDEQNARALGVLGATIAALALASWAVFKHFAWKANSDAGAIPSLEEFRQILESEKEKLVEAASDLYTNDNGELRRQISELDKKLKDVETAHELSVDQNKELTNRLHALSEKNTAGEFIEGIAAFKIRNLDAAEKHFEGYLQSIEPQLRDAASAFLGVAMARAERADWRGAADAYTKSLMLHETEYALGQASKFLWYSGNQETALVLSTKLVDRAVRSHGEKSEEVARARALMAGQLYDLRDLASARSETAAALSTLEALGQRDDCFYFNLLMNMGNINFVDGDLESAYDFHNRALTGLVENSCDPEIVVAARNGLAETLRVQGKIADSHKLLSHNLDESRSIFGERHPHTARALNFLAKCEFDKGELKSSLQNLLLSLEIQSETLGDFHHNSISIASNVLGISRDHKELQSDQTEAVERKYGAIIDQGLEKIEEHSRGFNS